MSKTNQSPDVIIVGVGKPDCAPVTCSTDQMKKLAIAAMTVCGYRPHPKEWWDDTMKQDREKEYEAAMRDMRILREELGL